MKTNRTIAAALVAAFAAVSLPAAVADDTQMKAKEENKAVVKPYKLDVCIVSGEKLGEMGKPVSFVYNGQEIKLCCKNCRKAFDKDPAKYLKKLEGK